MLSLPNFTILRELKYELLVNPEFIARQDAITNNSDKHPDCVMVQGLILQKGRIWLPRGFCFIPMLLREFHVTPTGKHMGITKTLAKVKENFLTCSLPALGGPFSRLHRGITSL